MSDEMAINVSIKPTWSIVNEIQEKCTAFMESKGKDKDLTEATMMCVTELIENAVKYGTEKPGGGNIEFELHADNDRVSVVVSNGINADDDITILISNIDRIKATDDPAQLYTERLMELMENPKPGVSQLGLFRIAYEGEFSLDYKYENNVLTISADRNI
ncbi:MAG: hypothetical protein GY754_42945 [bacterium]|nr:hypothetical protein [bacterium]